jgi:hypothetical protein
MPDRAIRPVVRPRRREGRALVLRAAPSFAEHERRGTREAQLLATDVDVPRAGLP